MLPQVHSHWFDMTRRVSRDAGILLLSFALGVLIRFGHKDTANVLILYAPSIIVGVGVLVSAAYIMGLYSTGSSDARPNWGFVGHSLLLLVAVGMALCATTLVSYVNFSSRVGRGVMALSLGGAVPLLMVHHWLLYHRHRVARQRLAFVVESPEELAEYHHIREICPKNVSFVGVITISDTPVDAGDPVLGSLDNADSLIVRHRLDRIVFAPQRYADERARPVLSRLRYGGTPCLPLVSLCEEMLLCAPLELLTDEWLLNAATVPQAFYLRKIKRAFDIIVSLALLVILSPALLAGMAVVKLVSDGPVFFRQRRNGRFGRPFDVVKLRTMRVDAEKDGPQWAAGDADPRLIPGGRWLRKYRIDEIPQLFNILRGDMSFVGPRPEQPVFVGRLEKEVPFYRERFLVQPGLTGWAQVRYPYGASTEDARRKLEYDLYYMKHMGLIFDLLILLDTIGVVLAGGVNPKKQKEGRFVLQPEPVVQPAGVPPSESSAA